MLQLRCKSESCTYHRLGSVDWVRLKLTSITSDVTYLFTVCKLSNLLTLPILNFKLNTELKESLVLRKAVNSRILRCTPQWTFMKSSARLLRMRCATNANCRLTDRRPADLQTCRLADLQTRSELTAGGGGELPPQGSRPEGEIPRRHSSNSRVY